MVVVRGEDGDLGGDFGAVEGCEGSMGALLDVEFGVWEGDGGWFTPWLLVLFCTLARDRVCLPEVVSGRLLFGLMICHI